jgi:hypothetical protein
MRRAGVVIIAAALLALAGCKSADSKSGDDKAPGGTAGRNKKDTRDKDKDGIAKGPNWLDDTAKWPGAGTDVPKGTGSTDPKIAAQELLSGRVLDPDGKPARNIFVRVEQVGVAPGPAEQGVYTNNEGYFQSPGKPGKAYEVTAEATSQNGRKLVGVVQTKVPNATLLIVLRDDLAAGGTFPPPPKPSDKVNDNIPPTGLSPKVPADGAWTPGGAANNKPPTTIGGTPGTAKPPAGDGHIPPPAEDVFPPTTKPMKPENFADGPKDPFKPPAANIPGFGGSSAPPVPPLPALPPSFGPTGGGKSSMNAVTPGKLALVDTLDRPWNLDSVKPGSLVLVEFMDTTSPPCSEFVPVLKDLQSRYGASGLELAGVVCDNLPQKDRSAVAAKFGRDNNLNYALYVEPGAAGSVRDQFRIKEYPDAVLLDSTGKVLWHGHPGKRAEIEAVLKQYLAK